MTAHAQHTRPRAAQEAPTRLRVETVMMGPETDQYAGKGQAAPTIAEIAATAKRLEGLGFDGVTAPEAGRDPFLPLAVAAEHTQRASLGTNVAIAFARSPMATAQVSWDLQNLSNGRFLLGLGTQVKGHIERRYAAQWNGPPGPRLRDYLLCMQAMFATFQRPEDPTFYEGTHYRFTLMNPFFNPGPIDHPAIPIYIAAVNDYMARLAGELCDGLRPHPIATFRFVREVILENVRLGAKKAGRKRDDIDVVGAPFLAIGEDEKAVERAKRDIKQHIAFYGSTRTYHSVFQHHGWQEVGAKLHRLSKQGKWTEMPLEISDDMLAEWAVIATYDNLAAELKKRAEGAFDTLLLDLPPSLWRDDQRVRDIVAALQ